jgi:hypothetical protein
VLTGGAVQGLWDKVPGTARGIVRALAQSALKDVAGLVLLALLVVTVYRLPGTLRLLRKATILDWKL